MAVAAGATTRINPPDEDQRPASAKHRFFLARKVLPKDGRSKKQIKRGTGEASRQSSSTSKEPSKTLAAQMGKPKLELRKRLGLLLDSPKSSWSAVAIQFMVIAVIILSVFNFFLSTLPTMKGGSLVSHIETSCAIFFTIEIGLRTYVATQAPKQMMLCDPTYWIDVLSVVPFYIEQIVSLISDSGASTQWATAIRVLQLLRLLRIIKLFRHYSAWRVILLALKNSWRALMVPAFAMFMIILILSGALYLAEESALTDEELADPYRDGFKDGFDAMWVLFWLVATLGFDGYMGADTPAHRLIIACALLCGLIFTTMPITIIGEAFRSAWERKEVLEAQMKIQDLLIEQGKTINELDEVFNQLDASGDGALDWSEFKEALKLLGIKVPMSKARVLWAVCSFAAKIMPS